MIFEPGCVVLLSSKRVTKIVAHLNSLAVDRILELLCATVGHKNDAR